MTIPLTKETLAAAYDYLRSTPPFCRWALPETEDVLFCVTRSRKTMGTHSIANGKHLIEVSRNLVGHTETLMRLMSHEMTHAHMKETGLGKSESDHGKTFYKLAKQVCKVHGFDPHEF